MTDTDRTYNGWTNYETWAVKLWLDNEQSTMDRWRTAAQEALDYSRSFPGQQVLSATDHAVSILEDQLKEAHEESDPLNQEDREGTVYSDLLRAALDEVNWREIARNIIGGLDSL